MYVYKYSFVKYYLHFCFQTPCPTGHAPTTPMMPSPQDSNGGEMPPYGMRNMPGGIPPGPNPMVNKNDLFSLKYL